jgi:hypothetical protein
MHGNIITDTKSQCNILTAFIGGASRCVSFGSCMGCENEETRGQKRQNRITGHTKMKLSHQNKGATQQLRKWLH